MILGVDKCKDKWVRVTVSGFTYCTGFKNLVFVISKLEMF